MNKLKIFIFVSIASLLFTNVAISSPPHGKGGGNTPPGWQKGEKEGWNSDQPPGLEKNNNKNAQERNNNPRGWEKGDKDGWESRGKPPKKGKNKGRDD